MSHGMLKNTQKLAVAAVKLAWKMETKMLTFTGWKNAHYCHDIRKTDGRYVIVKCNLCVGTKGSFLDNVSTTADMWIFSLHGASLD